jgi:hypothetical protein
LPKLLGKPIRIEDFKISSYGTDWIAFLDKVPEGYLQETDANYGTLQTAITRLESAGKIIKGEYAVRSRRKGKKAIVYVFHNPKTAISETKREHREKGPNAKDIENFVLKQPDYEHSLGSVQQEFYKRLLSSRTDAREYHRSYNLLSMVRKRIETEHHGKFNEELKNDGRKVYRFSKQE